jgi:hypothetical protein
MAAIQTVAVGAILLVVGVLAGRWLGKPFGDSIGLVSNVTQALGGVFYVAIFGSMLFLGGWVRSVAFIMVILGAAIATTRTGDGKDDWRKLVNGQ